MTQKEYDDKMTLVNMQMDCEIKTLRNELTRLEQEKSVINQQIDALRMKSRELGSRYLAICNQINDIKTRYKLQKQSIYNERPKSKSDE